MKLTKILSTLDETIGGMLIGLAITGIFSIVYISILNNKPSALDVYRGKTTLEITYKDSIPIDSVVVFK